MFRCPTSEFPICPSGRPTARPEASSVVHGQSRKRASKRGFSAAAMALYSVSRRQPKPSRTMRMTKGRAGIRGTLSRECADSGGMAAALQIGTLYPYTDFKTYLRMGGFDENSTSFVRSLGTDCLDHLRSAGQGGLLREDLLLLLRLRPE